MVKETEQAPKTTTVRKTKTRKGWRVARNIFIVLLLVGLAGFGGYYFKQYNDLKNNPQSAEETQKEENKKIIESVGKLYSLPQDEEPTIFFVSDKDKLSEEYKKQEFFQKAINGDYILIYEQAKIAILYRPSENRLVDVRPYTVQNSLSLAVIGAETARNAADAALKAAFKNEITIVAKTDAKNAYTGVTVVDVSGKYAEQTKKIASTLKGKVGTLPEGETKPDGADIIVIAGAKE